MRIIIEVEETSQQSQTTVIPPSIPQQIPNFVKPPLGSFTDAGQAPTPTVIERTASGFNTDTTQVISQSNSKSAGAAPNFHKG